MKRHYILLVAFLLAPVVAGCSGNHRDAASSRPPELPEFKAAIIAYIDSHPGYFIGRPNSAGLKDKRLIQLESPDEEPKYALEEFIIYPDKMRFQANYGVRGPEPYLYEGRFKRTEEGGIELGDIELTRHHVLPQQDAPEGADKPRR
ncbi:MAG: hypothetical protein ACYSWU_01760 [Planctomycetota bacterium]|jgi:hypothetical protein